MEIVVGRKYRFTRNIAGIAVGDIIKVIPSDITGNDTSQTVRVEFLTLQEKSSNMKWSFGTAFLALRIEPIESTTDYRMRPVSW